MRSVSREEVAGCERQTARRGQFFMCKAGEG